MISSNIDKIGPKNLNNNFKTVNGIGFCYFDPVDEVLKEFNSTAVLPVYPGEISKRQFYIVIDNMTLTFNTIEFKAESSSSKYIVKSSLDYNFDEVLVDPDNVVVAFYSQYPTGIIPVTIFIKNEADTVEDVDLKIELETF